MNCPFFLHLKNGQPVVLDILLMLTPARAS